jgi:hypothetical protein
MLVTACTFSFVCTAANTTILLQKIAEEGMQGVDCVRTMAVLRREDMLLDLHTVRTHHFVDTPYCKHPYYAQCNSAPK